MSEAAMLAVVRASRPQFSSAHDKLAFAVHAFLLAEGYQLVAAGAAAEDEGVDWALAREEVGPEGWNGLDGAYAFRYQDSEGTHPPLYVKCLAVGPQLLVHWLPGAGPASNPTSGSGSGAAAAAKEAAAGQEPRAFELDSDAYTTEAATAPACYKDAGGLAGKLRQQFGAVLSPAGGAGAGSSTAAAQRGEAAAASGSGRAEREAEPLRDERGASGIGYRPPGIPVGIGTEDVVPPGMRPPGYGGGGGFPGLMEPGPHRGGGMLVGPGDPIFGPGRMGGGVGAPPGHPGLPPGARWDPIAPPGMRGFHPDDYQQPRPPGQVHPDMMQPGPGRGTDFDQMFG